MAVADCVARHGRRRAVFGQRKIADNGCGHRHTRRIQHRTNEHNSGRALFQKTAKPIATVFKTAKSIISRFSAFANKKIVIVTARGDLDDKNVFLDTFKKYGFDISKVYVHRAGNVGGADSAQNKKVVIRELIKDGKYEMVRLFDDAKSNLDALHELESEFPEMKFETFYVDHSGSISRYKTTK